MKRNLQILSFIAFSFLFTTVAFAQPANDDCTDAISIALDEMVDFTTINATSAGPFHLDAPCPSSASDSIFNDIWYSYTSGFTGEVMWSLCGMADFDSRIAVYNPGATCPLSDGDLMVCNEDGPAACTNSESEVSFPVQEGQTYMLRLGGFGSVEPGAQGTGSFTLVELDAPDNNSCSNAIAIDLGIDQQFSNIGASTDGPDHPNNSACFGFGDITIQMDIWYTYTAGFTGSVQWSTCDQINFDSRMAVYNPGVSCPVTDPDLYACNDDGTGCAAFTSKLIFDVEEGSTYLLRLGGFGGEQGQGTFDLEEIVPPTPPDNDLCANPADSWLITPEMADEFDVTHIGTTNNGTFDSDNYIYPNVQCFGFSTTSGEFSDVWFTFNNQGISDIQARFFSQSDDAEFFFELFTDCGTPIDTMTVFNSCMEVTLEEQNPTTDITGLANTPTDYLIRITTRVTTQLPGDFFFQLVSPDATGVFDPIPGSFSFHPNPTSGNLFLNLSLDERSNTTIEIVNTLGQNLIVEDQGELAVGNHQFNFDVSKLGSGIYFLVIKTDNAQSSTRFVKE